MTDPKTLLAEDVETRLELLFLTNPELEVDDLRSFSVPVVEFGRGREGLRFIYHELLRDPNHETGRGMFASRRGLAGPWVLHELVPPDEARFYRDLVAQGEKYFGIEKLYTLHALCSYMLQVESTQPEAVLSASTATA